MISSEHIDEIRLTLESSSNPLFLYDNDPDGFCSYVLLRRALGRGVGCVVKSYPDLAEHYLDSVDSYGCDLIVVLDRADISDGFITGAADRGIPLLWIDHHHSNTDSSLIEQTFYYNSLPGGEPTTCISQKIFSRGIDEWIAMAGCVSDVYLPSFSSRFSRDFPELYDGIDNDAFSVLQRSGLRTLILMIHFALMQGDVGISYLEAAFLRATGPYDILEENPSTKLLHSKYRELSGELQHYVERAIGSFHNSPVLYFSYTGKTSMSALIANRLYYTYPNSLIVVGYKRSDQLNISIRGRDALRFTRYLTSRIDGSTGGGHEVATGAMVPGDKISDFEELIYEWEHNKAKA